MILSFDKFERYEVPQITLCNPNSRATEVDGKITITDTVGVLSNPKGMNLKLNFNAPHELSFDYYRHKSTAPIKQSFYDSVYEAIQTDRYIYLTDIGYFVISSVTDSDEDNIDKKSITCKSCEENEFAIAEGLHLKEGTYYLHTDNSDGLLDLFLSKTAGWTMGYIDPSLLTKPYFVEDTEVDNGYNFLYTTIQDMFECIVEPDIIKRTISVYSRVYYAEHHLTDIHIAKYNLLKHKTVEENDEDKYTALNVQGKDENLEIRVVNPTGKNIIYNFEPRHSMMSSDLQIAVIKWQEKCESVEEEYLRLQQGYYNDMQNIVFPLEQDIKVLELQLKEQQQTRDLIVIGEQDKAIDIVESLPQTGKSDVLYFVPTTANSYKEYVWKNDSWKYIGLIQVDDISDTTQQRALDLVNAAINNTNTELSTKQSTLDDEKKNIETNYSQPLSQINKDCALDTTAVDIKGNTIFTVDLLNELMTHIKPTDYVDEYMLVTESMTYPQRFEKAKELMDRAQSQLVKISSGQKTYSIDTRSFLFNKQFKHFSEQLCAGAIMYVETKKDKMEQLHLTGIGINFDEKNADFTLGNKYDRSDLKALYEDALGKNSKSFNELKYIAGILEDQQKLLYGRNWVEELRTLTLDNVLTSEDQAIEINNRGLIGRKRKLDENGEWDFDENGNPFFEPEQVKLINNTLVFTDKNWQNATTAVGKIAVGYNPDGSIKYAYGINGQVLIGELILGNNLVLTGTGAGIKITDSNGNDAFYADDEGNLVLSGKIESKSGTIGGWNITGSAIESWKYDGENGSLRWVSLWSYYPPLANGYQPNHMFLCREYHDGTTSGSYTDYFDLRADGRLWATKAHISGEIAAETGKIATWTIDTNVIKNGNIGTSGSAFMCTGTDGAYTLGGHTGTGWVFGAGSNFGVNNQGQLFASGAKISGTLSAGGWTIGGGAIICDKYSNANNNFLALMAPTTIASSGAGSDVFVVRVNGVDNFRLNSDGSLYCTKATITGTLQAGSMIGSGYISDATTGFYARSNDKNNYIVINNNLTQLWNNTYGSIGFSSSIMSKGDNVYQAILRCASGYKGAIDGKWQVLGNILNSAGSTAVSSDINKKHSVENIGDKYGCMFDNLRPITYKYKEGTSGRKHTGFIAQEVKTALDTAKIDTKDFAGLVIDNLNTDNEDWYIRYEEFIALNTWQIQRCKSRITELENTVAELKTQIQTLTAG